MNTVKIAVNVLGSVKGRSSLANSVLAKIVTPPRNTRKFFEELLASMKKLSGEAQRLTKDYESLPQEDVDYVLQSGGHFPEWLWDVDSILKTLTLKERNGGSKLRLESNIDYFLNFAEGFQEQLKVVGYLLRELEYWKGEGWTERYLTSSLEPVDSARVEERAGYAFEDPRQIKKIVGVVEGVQKLVGEFQQVFTLAEGTLEAISFTMGNQYEAQYDRAKAKPYRTEGDAVETLYHATVNADDLAANGFSTGPLEGALGLGGSLGIKGHEAKGDAVSFTTSLEEAEDIAETLKEVSRIGRGELTIEDLRQRAEKDGVLEKVDASSLGKHGELDPKNLEDVFYYYKTYLALSPKAYDPLFFGVAEDFAEQLGKIPERDIGVVEAQVDLDAAPYEYLRAMYEVRALPEVIQSVKRVS